MLNLARLLIGMVFFFNMECALLFLATPGLYAGGFELQGETGNAIVRAFGILFIMWNVPYAFALWHPVRYKISLIQAAAMQTIGLAGESWLLWSLTGEHPLLRQSVVRFIIFDAGGLAALALALWLVLREVRHARPG
jgi:hypothetical protein